MLPAMLLCVLAVLGGALSSVDCAALSPVAGQPSSPAAGETLAASLPATRPFVNINQ